MKKYLNFITPQDNVHNKCYQWEIFNDMFTAYRCSLHATRSHLRIAKESSLLNFTSIKYLDRCFVQHLNTEKSLLSSFINNWILHKYKNNIVPLCESNMSSSNSTTGRSSEFEGQDSKNSDAKVCDNKNASDSLKATMKQIPRHIAKTQIHQKEQPAEISLNVLGTGAQGTPQSLLIVMNAFRYIKIRLPRAPLESWKWTGLWKKKIVISYNFHNSPNLSTVKH